MAAILTLLIGYGAWSLASSASDEKLILTPIIVGTALVLSMMAYLRRRDRFLPIADVGVLCAVITLVYAAMPAIFYMKSGFVWTELSDPRLVLMKTTPEDVANLLWAVCGYLAALCLSYGWLRGAGMPGPAIRIHTDRAQGYALFSILALALAYQFSIERLFNIDLNPSNEALQDSYGIQQLPLFLGQITHNIIGIGRLAKLGLIAFAISRRNWPATLVLTAWLLLESYSTLRSLGARTNLAMLFLAVALSYHRMIKPIGAVAAICAATLGLGGLLGYGYLRDMGASTTSVDDVWSAMTEFQVLLANGLHASWAYDRGIISEVPWALRLSDLVMLIPQQLLPFQKLDPTDWYVDQIGAAGDGVGLMFGVVAQSSLGYGLVELVARGAVLGAVLALVHRNCVRRADSLTSFIVYLWLCVSVYYTYRATTFYITVYAVYRVLPFVGLFLFLTWLFRVLSRRADRKAMSGAATA